VKCTALPRHSRFTRHSVRCPRWCERDETFTVRLVTGLPQTELLRGHPVVRAMDVDEAHEAVTRTYLPHRLEVLDREIDLDVRLNAVRVGAVTAGYLRYGSAVRLGTVDAGNYHVNIPVAGRCEQRCGSWEPVFAGPGRAAVFMPGYPADLRWGAACAQLCLMIDRHELELELQRQMGRPLGERLRFTTAMDLGTPAARSWLEVIALLEREEPGDRRSAAGPAEQLQRPLARVGGPGPAQGAAPGRRADRRRPGSAVDVEHLGP
jgi:hypothetical protein